ncbi:hypothetical protein [Micromonospora chokoriensis]|uniref:hypothetical protein n=1 Tax=Micromonospora chokoriensis TaxID=356851 RepID=UPI0012FAA810|nr:hypothetical protein [Micromonospora chokoriensis]
MLTIRDASERWKELCHDFLTHFRPTGYRELQEIPVTQQVDPSVDFIGSNTNLIKVDLLAGRLPAEGVLINQACLRTQNLKTLNLDSEVPYRASAFRMIGATVWPEMTPLLAHDCATWFRSFDRGHAQRLVVWLSSADKDLVDLVETYFADSEILYDTQPPARYRHVYGVPGLTGRNFNFGTRNELGFADIAGNLVIMEKDGVPIASELGISVPMVLALRHNVGHPILASPVAENLVFRNAIDIKLADCLAISQLLLAAGMRPRKKGRKRTLRTALQSAAILIGESSNDLAAVESTIGHLYASQGVDPEDVPQRVARYIELSDPRNGQTNSRTSVDLQSVL